MKTYIVRRILQSIPLLIGITIVVFFISHASPGSPVSKFMDPNMTSQEKARLEARFGLDQPIYKRYISWVSEAVLERNLGYSTLYAQPVTSVIKDHMWNTFALSLFAMIISLVVGIPTGIISATKQYTLTDGALTVFSLLGISMPSFFFGLLLLKVFAIDLQWLPLSGMITPGIRDLGTIAVFKDIFNHAILPAVVLGLGASASFMRYTRSSMLEVIRQDYIMTARAKGLRERVVIYKHALRNALIPIITLLGFRIPLLFSGAILVETIFGWPGMGKIAIDAINNRDYPLLMGTSLLLSSLTLLGNLMADIMYGFADPRIKYD